MQNNQGQTGSLRLCSKNMSIMLSGVTCETRELYSKLMLGWKYNAKIMPD